MTGASRGLQQKRNTTVLCVRKGSKVVIMADGQVTIGERAIAKGTAKKLRRVGNNVLVGFAGSTADAMTLMEKLEAKITEFPGQLLRSCVELAKEWRGDKSMRQLNASMIVASDSESLEIDGVGNVIAPEEDGVLAIGSGGLYAKSAAQALVDIEGLDAEAICRKSMKIASSIDVFSNTNYNFDTLDKDEPAKDATGSPASSDGGSTVGPIITPAEGTPADAAPASDAGGADSTTGGTTTEPAKPSKGGGGKKDKKAAASAAPALNSELEALINDRVEALLAQKLAGAQTAATHA